MRRQEAMTDELFDQLTKEDKWIDAISNPITCLDKYFKFSHYRTCSYPVQYTITERQISKAKELYYNRKAETLASIAKGELVFSAMGCDFNSNYVNGVGNYRIRCYFKNSDGHKYFIELSCPSGNDRKFHIDYSVDEALRERRDREREQEFEYRRSVNGHWSINDKQDYCNCFEVEHECQNMTFTFDNVVKFVNNTYGCSYSSARLIRYFATYKE